MFALCFRISEILIIKKMTDPGRQKKSETNNNGTSLNIYFRFDNLEKKKLWAYHACL